eukprot:snap_masked-scaffold_21-processed-gene-5.90-mRNA-1 protein AED:1.00 eAED:1.00 QI:0/0/0/0/1/1/2/0/273
MSNSTGIVVDDDSIPESKNSQDWIFAIILVLLGSFFAALGDNLVKFSYTLEQARLSQGENPTPVLLRPLWNLGMFSLIFLNSIFTLWSYALADASIIIPFTGIRIIINMFFAKKINQEVFSQQQIGYTFIILLGITIALLSGNHKSKNYHISDFKDLFGNGAFVLISLGTLLVLLALSSEYIKSRDATKKCLILSMTSGIFASVTQLFAKIVSESFKDMKEGEPKDPVLGLYLVLAILFGGLHIMTLNHALKFFNAFIISPYLNATLIIFGSF